MNSNRPLRFELPKSILGRIAFGTVCVPLLAFSAVFSYAYLCGIFSGRMLAGTLEGVIFHHLGGAIFEGLFLFSLLGLVWSVAAPPWIDRLFQSAAWKLMLLLVLLCLKAARCPVPRTSTTSRCRRRSGCGDDDHAVRSRVCPACCSTWAYALPACWTTPVCC